MGPSRASPDYGDQAVGVAHPITSGSRAVLPVAGYMWMPARDIRDVVRVIRVDI